MDDLIKIANDKFGKGEIQFFFTYLKAWYGFNKKDIREHVYKFLSTYDDFELTTEARESFMTYLEKNNYFKN